MRLRTSIPFALSLLLTACAGIKVNVNGEEKTYFGPDSENANADADVDADQSGEKTAIDGSDAKIVGEKEVTIPGDFAPSPMVVQSPNIFFNSDLGKKGWNDCGYKDTTQAPVMVFTLDAPPNDLQVRLAGHPGVLVAPDGSVNCVDTGLIENVAWTDGDYEYYPKSTNQNYESGWGEFEFSSPARVQTEVAERFKTTLSTDGDLNPMYATVAVGDGPRVRASHVDLAPCMRRGRYFVVPVATLEVATTSKFQFDSEPYRPLFIRTEDGKCIGPEKKKYTNAEVPKGTHQLYALWDRSTKEIATSYEVAVFDEERKIAFADAETIKLGKSLDEPKTLVTTTGKPALRARAICNQGDRQPAFFIEATDRDNPTKLKHLSGPGGFAVFGPLEAQFDRSRLCRRGDVPKEAGTYAVFVNATVADAPVAAALGNYKAIDPLTPTTKPADNPSLADRVIDRYFGYYMAYTSGEQPVEALFATAPAQLFVFPKQARKGLLDNEPLLLVSHGDDMSKVVRLTGEIREVRTEQLATAPTGEVSLPDLTAPESPKDAPDALGFAGPVERRLYEKYDARNGKFRGCVVKYMRKHDKTWGKDYELVYTNSGETMTDRQFKKANRKCGLSKLESYSKRIGKQMHRSRIKAQERARQSLPSKF